MNKICIFTLGCKVNQYESESIADALRERGYAVTDELSVCDAYVINTCAVTKEAERKSRQVIAKIHRLNENAPIYIVGCASQKDSQAFAGKKNVKVVRGTAGKREIVNLLDREGVFISPPSAVYEDDPRSATLKTRAFIKIQDGCDSFCSYCIIPYLRGRSRSRDPVSIREEILSLSGSVKEFVLTGINISDYSGGLDKLMEYLSDLDVRIRLGSLEAGIADRRLLDSLKKLKKFCPHFHLSLQSGSDRVLKSMNRHYTSEDYLSSIKLIREYYPEAAVTTDIICGFPCETEEDFKQTVEVAQKARFSDIHIFNYSPREGTAAAKLKLLDNSVVKEREEILKQLKYRLKGEFTEFNLGRQRFLLTETLEDGLHAGYSENYLKLYVEGDLELNEVYKVIPYEKYLDGARARLAK